MLIGLLAGVVHNLVYELLLRLRLDDPVGAIPVHLGCGVLGTMCVGFFGDAEMLNHSRGTQIGVQALGALACMVWSGGVSLLLFLGLKATVGLRVSPVEENMGISLAGLRDSGGDSDLTADELRGLMG
jgi:Amt family ammonium transporter